VPPSADEQKQEDRPEPGQIVLPEFARDPLFARAVVALANRGRDERLQLPSVFLIALRQFEQG